MNETTVRLEIKTTLVLPIDIFPDERAGVVVVAQCSIGQYDD